MSKRRLAWWLVRCNMRIMAGYYQIAYSQHVTPAHLKENHMPRTDERMRPFALRLPEKLFLDIQHLAHQEKRFINAQILYILEQAHDQIARSER